MKKNNAARNIFATVYGMICTMVLLLAILVSIPSVYSLVTAKSPTLFGYSILNVSTSPLNKRGFDEQDYVVLRKAASPNMILRGDTIAYYAHEDNTPIYEREGKEAREDSKVLLREVDSIFSDGKFVVKDANGNLSTVRIPFESIIGVRMNATAAHKFFLRYSVTGNSFVYWIVAFFVLIALRQLFIIGEITYKSRLKRDALSGKINFLDRQCLVTDVYSHFTRRQKSQLVANAPYKMGMLYEYLLTNKVTKLSDENYAQKLKGKHYDTSDILAITFGEERGSTYDNTKHIDELSTTYKKSSRGYHNLSEYRHNYHVAVARAISILLGSVAFVLFYFYCSTISIYFETANWFEFAIVISAPLLAIIYLCFVACASRVVRLQLERCMSEISHLPERYHFIVNPEAYTPEQIAVSYKRIELLLERGRDDAPDDEDYCDDEIISEDSHDDQPVEEVEETEVIEEVEETEVIEEAEEILTEEDEEDEEIVIEQEEDEEDGDEDEDEDEDEEAEENEEDEETEVEQAEEIRVEQAEAEETIPVEENQVGEPEANEGFSFATLPDRARYPVSFETRMRMASDVVKERFNTIVNMLIRYRKVKCRVSSKFAKISFGRTPLCKIVVKNKTIKFFLNLELEECAEKYNVRDNRGKKAFVRFPTMLPVRGSRGFLYATQLAELLIQKYELEPRRTFTEIDFVSIYEYVNPFEGAGTDHEIRQFVLAEYPRDLRSGLVAPYLESLDKLNYEVKLRWTHEEFGEIDCREVVPVLDVCGIRRETDETIANYALIQAAKLRRAKSTASIVFEVGESYFETLLNSLSDKARECGADLAQLTLKVAAGNFEDWSVELSGLKNLGINVVSY